MGRIILGAILGGGAIVYVGLGLVDGVTKSDSFTTKHHAEIQKRNCC